MSLASHVKYKETQGCVKHLYGVLGCLSWNNSRSSNCLDSQSRIYSSFAVCTIWEKTAHKKRWNSASFVLLEETEPTHHNTEMCQHPNTALYSSVCSHTHTLTHSQVEQLWAPRLIMLLTLGRKHKWKRASSECKIHRGRGCSITLNDITSLHQRCFGNKTDRLARRSLAIHKSLCLCLRIVRAACWFASLSCVWASLNPRGLCYNWWLTFT